MRQDKEANLVGLSEAVIKLIFVDPMLQISNQKGSDFLNGVGLKAHVRFKLNHMLPAKSMAD